MGWMDLPLELLELIFQRLCLDDAMNGRATCRSWRKAADAIFSSQLPLMLSLSTSTSSYIKSDSNNFGSLSAPWSNHDSTVFTETWPQGINRTDNRVHSVQGWLMFNIFHYVSDKSQTFSELSFFNPFSRARFKLPKLFLFSGKPDYHQVRVAFNSAPPGSEEFVLAFLCVFSYKTKRVHQTRTYETRLAFIKFKQGSWIELETTETAEIFYDIEVHGDNKLYGLTVKHKTRVVFVFTLRDNHRDDHVVERLVMLNNLECIFPGNFVVNYEFFRRSHQMVMDTSTGELLLVRHDRCASDLNGCYDSICTKGFRVFKLDRSNLRWCEVFDIGNRFLFWDYTKVSLVSAKGLRLAEQFKRGNCIFFCHANTHREQKYPIPDIQDRFRIKEHDMGVFFLADRTISHFSINSSLPFSLLNMWFSPAPWLV
ncbi:F-box/kelch-repeat protein At1g57790-like [Arachis ipaensis]|uniref:F-box/kelch-repeat protein At1g57790-like n=1 Tax=Arachis ipaensis TaxID=130454 RepID=UPI0007AFCA01|nr:F-box/kelch-repeat protein At1g57790-like [Arachis ipaensis]XP_025636558.1 F-box/kelch-repeat protein At1g57790-like [Arachis hypogaea]